jgi:hypothetical protein
MLYRLRYASIDPTATCRLLRKTPLRSGNSQHVPTVVVRAVRRESEAENRKEAAAD